MTRDKTKHDKVLGFNMPSFIIIQVKKAKTVFDTLINSNLSVDEIIEQKGLKQVFQLSKV